MKHLFFSVGLLCLMAAPISVSAQAQSTKDLLKERKELVKASKAELNAKATKSRSEGSQETEEGRLANSTRRSPTGEAARQVIPHADGV